MPASRNPHEDDLFKDSTMTFGEHLEELRRCLFLALIGLLVGFGIGLGIGHWVVQWIQTPLEQALETYYQQLTVDNYREDHPEGTPGDFSAERIEQFVEEERKIYDRVFVEPGELARALGQPEPAPLKSPPVSPPPSTKSPPQAEAPVPGPQLVPLRLWRKVDDDPRIRAKTLSTQEGFMIYIKAALLTGAVLSSPWVFFWLWSFVAAGLYPHEKKYVYIFLPFSLGLFFLGAAMAFFFVFDPVLNFLLGYNRWLGIDPDPRITEWLNFVLILPLGFGISFQLPLVMLFLERIGIFSEAIYRSNWRIAVLVIFAVSMVLTPADPYSMVLMAVPLTVLYYGGILLCRWMPRSRDEELEANPG